MGADCARWNSTEGVMAMKMELLEDYYIEELKDVLDAEKQLTKALPRMAEAASAPELKEAFQMHLRETEEQIKRLQQIFKRLEEPARGKKCKAMAGIIKEAEEFLGEEAVEEIVDVGLTAAAQKVEHYEIATYGTLATFAKLLGLEQDKQLLGQTLQEEKATDGKLTLLAEGINLEAADGELPGSDEEQEEEQEETEQPEPAMK
jgi:ferritin-like metal-binding protein YciE